MAKHFFRFAPLAITLLCSLVVNAIPAFRAFVLEEESWGQAGWAYYFFTCPAAGFMVPMAALLGFVPEWLSKDAGTVRALQWIVLGVVTVGVVSISVGWMLMAGYFA